MSARHSEAASRYELDTPHGLAIAVYREQASSRVYAHRGTVCWRRLGSARN